MSRLLTFSKICLPSLLGRLLYRILSVSQQEVVSEGCTILHRAVSYIIILRLHDVLWRAEDSMFSREICTASRRDIDFSRRPFGRVAERCLTKRYVEC